MPLTLYNTLARAKQVFEPADPGRVTLYVCGPTVYNYAHIGNARAAVVFDVLYRLLKSLYPAVIHARNVTDIDDKIIKAAVETGQSIDTLAAKFLAVYHADMAALGVLTPDKEPKATRYIGAMIAMIERLVASGHAYAADGHVLFHVPSFADYGRLSNRERDDMIAGARVEVAPYKKDPADFVMWKPSDPAQPGWPSPWGRGRPGWHIECSAMIESELGQTIDIHGGGHDLIFPHHENEIAQSTCAHGGRALARYWLHNGFVNMGEEKMSKSVGNVVLVHDLLREAPGEAIRLALLSAHYRQPLDWTGDGLAQARRTLDGLYGTMRRLKDIEAERAEAPAAFRDALMDDLNTPKAIAELSALARKANAGDDAKGLAKLKGELVAAGWLLGLLQSDPEAWFKTSLARHGDEDEIDRLVAERIEARKAKDFARADAIRQRLTALNVSVEDTADGAKWRFIE